MDHLDKKGYEATDGISILSIVLAAGSPYSRRDVNWFRNVALFALHEQLGWRMADAARALGFDRGNAYRVLALVKRRLRDIHASISGFSGSDC